LKHANSLHLLFNDGVLVSLQETDFVTRLAEQHRAAPSEFQILQALKDFIQENILFIGDNSRKRTIQKVLERIAEISDVPLMATITALDHKSKLLTETFYSSTAFSTFEHGVILFNPIETTSNTKNTKTVETILSLSKKKRMKATGFSQNSQDVAAGIICLQHFCYQNRLFLPNFSTKKRKKSAS
jgi:hypothetical protein